MKLKDAQRLESLLDQNEVSSLSEVHENASIQRAMEDAMLVRKALHQTLPTTGWSKDVASRLQPYLKDAPRASWLEKLRHTLSDIFYIPTLRWGLAAVVVLALFAPMGYLSLWYNTPSVEYVTSDLPGATIMIQVLTDDRGSEDQIVWVIGDEGATS